MRIVIRTCNYLGDTGSDYQSVETPEQAQALVDAELALLGEGWTGEWEEIPTPPALLANPEPGAPNA